LAASERTWKIPTARARNYRARSETALDVASNYPGAGGLNSFRIFLAAFNLTERLQDSRFHAFEIFGDPILAVVRQPRSGLISSIGEKYSPRRRCAGFTRKIRPAGGSQCDCARNFQNMLNDAFKAMMRRENRKAGFAFLDVYSASSYRLVFEFLLEIMKLEHMFIELDTYFENHKPPIPPLYQDFATRARQQFNFDNL
jgi:hypothetical protein